MIMFFIKKINDTGGVAIFSQNFDFHKNFREDYIFQILNVFLKNIVKNFLFSKLVVSLNRF